MDPQQLIEGRRRYCETRMAQAVPVCLSNLWHLSFAGSLLPSCKANMFLTTFRWPCAFSLHLLKLANGPVVLSKMKYLDHWPKAGG